MVPSSPIAGEESQGACIMKDHAVDRTRASATLPANGIIAQVNHNDAPVKDNADALRTKRFA
jgi:hypothetical protein